MNTSLSYCDDGNSSSIDFLLEGGVGLTVQFLKLNQTVKMMPSISFVPGIIFQNSSKDTSKIFLAFVLCLFEKIVKEFNFHWFVHWLLHFHCIETVLFSWIHFVCRCFRYILVVCRLGLVRCFAIHFSDQVTLHSTKGKLLPPANVSYTCYTGDTPIVMNNGSSASISYHGIISLTQIRVQAFDIKDGDLSPG